MGGAPQNALAASQDALARNKPALDARRTCREGRSAQPVRLAGSVAVDTTIAVDVAVTTESVCSACCVGCLDVK